LEKLEKQNLIAKDSRMFYFGPMKPPSSGKHSIADRNIREIYGGQCVLCASSENVTMAHIVSGSSRSDYGPFNPPKYKSAVDVKSVRNFLPLCGTDGVSDSCHNQFDKYLVTLLYDPTNTSYTVFSLNKAWEKHSQVHLKSVQLPSQPYRRLLAWRTRYCFMINASALDDGFDVPAFVDMIDFSEKSHSIANDGAEKESSSSG
jgi:hypothetical protein